MRRARRADGNQRLIVEALRDLGARVEVISDLGRGVPDLMVGYGGRNVLMEVKSQRKAKLTPAQIQWQREWKGQCAVVSTVDEALRALGLWPAVSWIDDLPAPLE